MIHFTTKHGHSMTLMRGAVPPRLAIVAACCWACVCGGPVKCLRAEHPSSVEQLLTRASGGREYQPISAATWMTYRELFVRTLRNAENPLVQQAWTDQGWQLQQLVAADPPTWVLYEPTAHRRGGGFYWLCPSRLLSSSAQAPVIWQAPHSFADQFTRNVALRLLHDGRFAAASWNTVHRKTIDVAHTELHPFSAFTAALLDVNSACYLVQVHGFSQTKRTSPAAAQADLIVSNGDGYPDPWLRKAVVLWQADFGYGTVRLYPTEVSELGATTNVQGAIFRRTGSQRFMHLEMSRTLRTRLVADPRARTALLKYLAESAD